MSDKLEVFFMLLGLILLVIISSYINLNVLTKFAILNVIKISRFQIEL